VTVIGIDDTDSRERGMCTTYVAARVAARVEATDGTVERTLLVRLNPAVEHKTRGNAALAVHCDLPADEATAIATDTLSLAATGDERTNPGLVVADCDPGGVPDPVVTFAAEAVRAYHDRRDAEACCERAGFQWETWSNGRGLIGALAAVGAWRAFEEWTYELVSYRERERWGNDREVDHDSVFAAADAGYPTVWDTIDREEGVAVCVPRTPCPILYGIRGDDPDAVRGVARRVESEPVARRHLFVTNQGTDAHLREGTVATAEDGYSYRLTGELLEPPSTREGGHVFFTLGEHSLADGNEAGGENDGDGRETLRCVAFEPTKRFRDRVRELRAGDRVTVCGEVRERTLKLEKFAVRDLVRTERVTPTCPDCGRTMESAGRTAGYRCRDCGTDAAGKAEHDIDRDIEEGWYEVPPCARRHVAKPLVRGGFDAPVHPER